MSIYGSLPASRRDGLRRDGLPSCPESGAWRAESLERGAKAVYGQSQELADQVVIVGGATVSLYADRQTEEARPTDDVDILVELTTYKYKDYGAMDEKLKEKGFVNDVESGMVCRYKIRGIVVDVMPTDEGILGFSNRPYRKEIADAQLAPNFFTQLI